MSDHEPNPRNLDSYYFSFESTKNDAIDAVLESVARAGRLFHSTDGWADGIGDGRPSPLQEIQQAANRAALIAATPQEQPRKFTVTVNEIENCGAYLRTNDISEVVKAFRLAEAEYAAQSLASSLAAQGQPRGLLIDDTDVTQRESMLD